MEELCGSAAGRGGGWFFYIREIFTFCNMEGE